MSSKYCLVGLGLPPEYVDRERRPSLATWKEGKKGGGGQITRKNGHICVFVSLKTAHLTVVLLHEGGEHYEEPYRCLIRQRLPPHDRGRVHPAKEVPTEKRADFFLSIWHTTRHQYQLPRRPRARRSAAGWNGWANSRSLPRCHFPACPT